MYKNFILFTIVKFILSNKIEQIKKLVEESCMNFVKLNTKENYERLVYEYVNEFESVPEAWIFQDIMQKNVRNKHIKKLSIHNNNFDLQGYLQNLTTETYYYKIEALESCIYHEKDNDIQDLYLIFDNYKFDITQNLKSFFQLSNLNRLEIYQVYAQQIKDFESEGLIHSYITPNSLSAEDSYFYKLNIKNLQNMQIKNTISNYNLISYTAPIQQLQSQQQIIADSSLDVYSLAMSIIFIENSILNCMDQLEFFLQQYEQNKTETQVIEALQTKNIEDFLTKNNDFKDNRNWFMRLYEKIKIFFQSLMGTKKNNFYDIIEQAVKEVNDRISVKDFVEQLKDLEFKEYQLDYQQVKSIVNSRQQCKNHLLLKYKSEQDTIKKNIYQKAYEFLFFQSCISVQDCQKQIEAKTSNILIQQKSKSSQIQQQNETVSQDNQKLNLVQDVQKIPQSKLLNNNQSTQKQEGQKQIIKNQIPEQKIELIQDNKLPSEIVNQVNSDNKQKNQKTSLKERVLINNNNMEVIQLIQQINLDLNIIHQLNNQIILKQITISLLLLIIQIQMNQDKENRSPKSIFYSKIKKDAQIYEKQNDNMIKFENLIIEVFQQEIFFTVSGELKRIKKNEKLRPQYIYIRSSFDEFNDFQRKSQTYFQFHKQFNKQITFGRANQIPIKFLKLLVRFIQLQLKEIQNLLQRLMEKINLIFQITQKRQVHLQIYITNKLQILVKNLKILSNLHKKLIQEIQIQMILQEQNGVHQWMKEKL